MDSFEVENFRSLKHLKLEKLARVNLLVGKNNSGKTSVLEALFALADITSAGWIPIIENERNLSGSKSDFRYLFYGFDTDNTIKFLALHRAVIGEKKSIKGSMRVLIEVPNNYGNKVSLSRRLTSVLSVNIYLSEAANAKPISFEINRSDEEISIIPKSKKAVDAIEVGIVSPLSARYEKGEIITTNIDRETLNRKIDSIKFNRLDHRLLENMKLIDSRIKAIELGAGGQIYFDLGEQFRTLLPINLMGEGIQRLLDIISGIITVSTGIVLIDEIDNGLHYSALRILWRAILRTAREYDVQVFVTTHSAEALRHLTWVLNDEKNDDEENASYRDDVAAYTLVRADDDTVRSYRHDYEQLDYALDHGLEIRN